MPLDTTRLLELLRCPQCRSQVVFDDVTTTFVCANRECRLQFPVRDEIPVMLIGDAEQLAKDAWEEIARRATRAEAPEQ